MTMPVELRRLEGHRVNLVLRDGSRLEGCQLVSGGRSRTRSLWLVSNDQDLFVALDDVSDLRETAA